MRSNFAIIGCKFIAKKHALAINTIPTMKLVTVCDRVQETMRFYTESYGMRTYIDSSENLKDPTIDVVCICTPSGLYASIAKDLARVK